MSSLTYWKENIKVRPKLEVMKGYYYLNSRENSWTPHTWLVDYSNGEIIDTMLETFYPETTYYGRILEENEVLNFLTNLKKNDK